MTVHMYMSSHIHHIGSAHGLRGSDWMLQQHVMINVDSSPITTIFVGSVLHVASLIQSRFRVGLCDRAKLAISCIVSRLLSLTFSFSGEVILYVVAFFLLGSWSGPKDPGCIRTSWIIQSCDLYPLEYVRSSRQQNHEWVICSRNVCCISSPSHHKLFAVSDRIPSNLDIISIN